MSTSAGETILMSGGSRGMKRYDLMQDSNARGTFLLSPVVGASEADLQLDFRVEPA
jgi:hypothetical protein